VSCAGRCRKGPNHLANMPCAAAIAHGFASRSGTISHARELPLLTFP
jgi:hypothetical protein